MAVTATIAHFGARSIARPLRLANSRSWITVPAVVSSVTLTPDGPVTSRCQAWRLGSSHRCVVPALTTTPSRPTSSASASSAPAAFRPTAPPSAGLRSVRTERAARVSCGDADVGGSSSAKPGDVHVVTSSRSTLMTGIAASVAAAVPVALGRTAILLGTVVWIVGTAPDGTALCCITDRNRGRSSSTPSTSPRGAIGSTTPRSTDSNVNPSDSADRSGGEDRRVISASVATGP